MINHKKNAVEKKSESLSKIRSIRLFTSIATVVYLFVMMIGCGTVGGLSRIKSFEGKDSLKFEVSRPDVLDIIAEVGKSLGYSVSGLDRGKNFISLSSNSTGAALALIGKIKTTEIRITSRNDGRELEIDYQFIGNLGTGGQEVAEKKVNEFKEKLTERISEFQTE